VTRPSLTARVERLEQRAAPALPPWQVELAEREAEYARRFPMPMSSWSSQLCDEFIAFHASDHAGRLDELRRMTRSPEQRAEERAASLVIASMNINQINDYFAMLAAPEENPPYSP
jgi:hypothetical protein